MRSLPTMLLLLGAALLTTSQANAQVKNFRQNCDKVVYSIIELSGEAGAQTGFNAAIGLASPNIPISAHLLLNMVPGEPAAKAEESEPDITVNPMLMLRYYLLNDAAGRHSFELVAAGGTSAYRLGMRYAYVFSGHTNLFVQPALAEKGYITSFGVNVMF